MVFVKVNNFRLALGMTLKFYTSVAKGLELKVRKFWVLIPRFVEVTRGKTSRGVFLSPPPILNRVKISHEGVIKTLENS